MRRIFAVIGLSFALASAAPAEEPSAPSDYAFEKGYPAKQTAERVRDDADYQRAIVAYRFWYPAVSAEAILEGNRRAGLKDNEAMGAAATSPRQVGFTLNSDTPYGAAALDLSAGPMVVELPPGAYIGLANDHYQGWILDLGLPGPDAGKGGKHLLLPPGYGGAVPEGYHVGRSNTFKVFVAIRAMPTGGDAKQAEKALGDIRIYPLATAGDPKPMKVVSTTDRDLDSSPLRWEDNIGYWEALHRIIDAEPLLASQAPMHSLLKELGLEKGKPFRPDAHMKAVLERAARDGRDQMLVSAFASNRPERMAWPDRKWEWAGLVSDNADFQTPTGMDLDARDRWFAQAIVVSPAMFRRSPGAGSLYWLGLRDIRGAYLDGGKTYRLRVPQPIPYKLFWSVTVYDARTRSEVQTTQNNAALRSLFELKDVSGNEPVDLYFGPKAPPGKENRWVKTNPDKGWFAYFRIYGPEAAAFDGSWKPDDFEEVQ